MTSVYVSKTPGGGRFDFDDGGTYCGGWEDGKAHGHGVCTGPKGQGEYSGSWNDGFEVSGVYTWPTGSTYEGEWANGKRHGLGVETRGRWIYRGEWTAGFKGRYGVRQSITSGAKYDGTWANGLQDGYGSETYADGGTFQGQWVKGMRHGYGVRSSAPFGLAAHTRKQATRRSPSLDSDIMMKDSRPEECRGGFVLKDCTIRVTGTWNRSLDHPKKSGFKALLSKPKLRRSLENLSQDSEGHSDGSDITDNSFVSQDEAIDANVIETYMGEWKNDKRCGFGIAERSDGIKFEGEWYNNKKFGYGITTFKNGFEEHGKYKNNVLLMSGGKKHLFILRSAKFRDRVEAAVNAAHRASQIALQKADIAISRTATARGKAEQADIAAKHAKEDSEIARYVAKQYAPEFIQPGSSLTLRKFNYNPETTDYSHLHVRDDLPHHRTRSLYLQNQGVYGSSKNISGNFEEIRVTPEISSPPPAQSALLDVFRNNPDRRPSAAGFLRRPSTINYRRPSTVIELKLVPSTVEESSEYVPNNPRSRLAQITLQQVVDEHFSHYYETSPERQSGQTFTKTKKIPIVDFSEIAKIYGLRMEDEEGVPILPQRRSTLPTVLDANNVPIQLDNDSSWGGEGIIRTGSLYSATRKHESASKSGTVNARKNSLPDITNIGGSEPRVLTRETIAALSSQRREAIRKQEEEAQRLRANPLLYLVNPDLWEWLSSQQLLILVVLINVGLAYLFFKVIL